jgi:Mn-dependent DtxR family transcriptional regulator
VLSEPVGAKDLADLRELGSQRARLLDARKLRRLRAMGLITSANPESAELTDKGRKILRGPRK